MNRNSAHRIPLIATCLVLACLLLMSGCATDLTSTVAPGTDLEAVKTAFVERLPADDRGVEKLIAEELARMGIQAASGDAMPADQDYDILVTYRDKWMWDITMYMIELRVQILKPDTRFVMASGYTFRTSLARKSPEEMVTEVMGEIFNEK